MATIKTVKAIVAARKTIFIDGKYCGPGEEVNVAIDEVAGLQAAGFLIDPGSPEVPSTGAGPMFSPADEPEGPSIT